MLETKLNGRISALIITTVALILAACVYQAQAADTGFAFPGTASQDTTVGTEVWGNPTIITADDGTATNCDSCSVSASVTDTTTKLIIGGSASGNNLGTNSAFSNGVKTYGGPTELWGLTPTPTQINASNFGFGLSVTGDFGVSQFLTGTNYGFTIPSDATINGIEATVDILNAGPNAAVDYFKVKVYYTASPAATGYVRSAAPQVRSARGELR